MRASSFLWITDPWHTLDHARDTTLRLASEAAALGMSSFWCDYKSISINNSLITAEACPIDASARVNPNDTRRLPIAGFSSIHYRVDPPVDLSYLHPLHLVTLSTFDNRHSSPEIVNRPSILTSFGEKLFCQLLPSCTPPTIVTCNQTLLDAFGEHVRTVIVKPLHGCQSKGVQKLSWASAGARAESIRVLSELSDGFQRPIVLQEYLPQVFDGETRVWYLDGEPIATALKLPSKGSPIIDIDMGDPILQATVTDEQDHTIKTVSALVRKCGVRLAAVDMIGSKVIDFNVTSPGLLCQMETVTGTNLARLVINKLTKPM